MKEKEDAKEPAAELEGVCYAAHPDQGHIRLDEGRADAVEQGQAEDQGKPEQAAHLGGDEAES
jgi:hypothetical protein